MHRFRVPGVQSMPTTATTALKKERCNNGFRFPKPFCFQCLAVCVSGILAAGLIRQSGALQRKEDLARKCGGDGVGDQLMERWLRVWIRCFMETYLARMN